MIFTLTPSQEEFRARAREAAQSICRPGAAARDRDSHFPAEEIRTLGNDGWFGLRDRRGGEAACDDLSAVLGITEFSHACASIGLLVGFHNFLVCDCIARYGSEEIQTVYLPKLASGECLGAVALSDPAISASGGQAAKAVMTEEGIHLLGNKRFVVGAVGAGFFLVYASTAREGDGLSPGRILLAVPRETPGLSVDAADPLVGVRASGSATLRFDDCLIPASMVIGKASDARRIGKELLASADLVVAAQAVGIGSAAMEKAVERARETGTDGTLIGSHQSVQFMIAEMEVQKNASQLFVQRAVDARAREDSAYRAAQAKTFAGRAAVVIADLAIQILGGDGSLADHGIERHWRDAKTCELNPSTRESAQLLVARHLLEEA